MKPKWVVLLLIWLMMLVAYLDRIDLAVAGTYIRSDLWFSKTQLGWVLAAFTLGYALMQAPGGWLADRFGSKPLLVVAILVWSVFTAFTGLASGMLTMIAIRIIFGVGEGVENGAQFKLVGDHFEPKERSAANALFLSALALGPALGTPLAAWIIGRYGWRELFYWFAGMGLAVGILLFLFLPVDKAPARETAKHAPFPWREALGNPATWLAMLGYATFNVAFWGFLSWAPTYMREERHIPLAKFGFVGSLPYLAGFVGMLVAGYLGSGVLIGRRAGLVAGCHAAAAICLYVALTAADTTRCVAGLTASGFFLYAGFGPFWALAIGLAPKSATGAFTGAVNFCGQVGAFLSQIIIGMLADRMKSFSGAISFMIGALVIGAASMALLQYRSVAPTVE